MSSADRVAHIDGQLIPMCEQYTRFRQSSTSNKTEQIIYECLLSSVFLTNIFPFSYKF